MTEREKMLRELPYCSADQELRWQSNHAKALIKEYNRIPAEDVAKRSELLKNLFGFCGQHVRVNQPLFVDYGCNITIGDDSFVNMNCTLLDTNQIIIGKRVLIGPDVKIYTALHPKQGRMRYQEHGGEKRIVTIARPVRIGDDVWIGGGTIVLPGVCIGSNTVVGAGSVVTKDIPEKVVAFGNPCRVMYENE